VGILREAFLAVVSFKPRNGRSLPGEGQERKLRRGPGLGRVAGGPPARIGKASSIGSKKRAQGGAVK
jgi:hypothetical protein